MLAPMRAVAALAMGLLCACGAARVPPSAPAALPPTDRDPLPFTPPPEPAGETDRTVALAASGGEDQARELLPALIRAVRDSDARRLEQILAEELVALQGQGDRPLPRPRAWLVERALALGQRQVIPPDAEVDDLVELASVQVGRVSQFWPAGSAPSGVRATDLVVEVQLTEQGRGPLRAIFSWHLRGRIVVRPGREPRIVAY